MVSDNQDCEKESVGVKTPTDFMIIHGKNKIEPLENVLMCMVGSIHFAG